MAFSGEYRIGGAILYVLMSIEREGVGKPANEISTEMRVWA